MLGKMQCSYTDKNKDPYAVCNMCVITMMCVIIHMDCGWYGDTEKIAFLPIQVTEGLQREMQATEKTGGNKFKSIFIFEISQQLILIEK